MEELSPDAAARLALKREKDRLGRRVTRAQQAEEKREGEEARRDILMVDYSAAVEKYLAPIDWSQPIDITDAACKETEQANELRLGYEKLMTSHLK